MGHLLTKRKLRTAQWSKRDLAKLRKLALPPLPINRIKPHIPQFPSQANA